MNYNIRSMIRKTIIGVFAVVFLSSYIPLSLAAGQGQQKEVDASKLEQTATLTFKGEAMNLILGGTWGEGVLTFKGKQYNFKAKSISAGTAAGHKEVQSKAAVYNLKKVEDFEGTYWGVRAGGTLFVGAEVANVQNDKEVLLNISGTSEGVAADIAAGLKRIVVELKK